MPIKLLGPWNDGYALDQYTVSSEYIGDDTFGRPQFINTYSEVGKLLHKDFGAETHYRSVMGGSAVSFLLALFGYIFFDSGGRYVSNAKIFSSVLSVITSFLHLHFAFHY